MDSAKAFIIAIMTLAIIAFAVLISIGALNDTSAAANTPRTILNEVGFINSSGYTLDGASDAGFNSVSITIAGNTSGLIPANEYTVSGLGVVTNTTILTQTSATFNYTYEYNQFDSINGNVSAGLVTLFTNAGTWFSLLAVVIIILIVAVVVIAVNRFGSASGSL